MFVLSMMALVASAPALAEPVSEISPAAQPPSAAIAPASKTPAKSPAASPGAAAPAPPATVGAVHPPKVLSEEDVERYRSIFRLQAAARWKQADAVIAQLKNRLLVGHILAQRYLNPCCYRAKYRELREWMVKYADNPDAQRIYELALRKRPRRARRPRRPLATPRGKRLHPYRLVSYVPGRPRLGRAKRRQARYLRRRVVRGLKRGRFSYTLRLLERHNVERSLGRVRYDQLRTRIAERIFYSGNPDRAYQITRETAGRSGKYITNAHWVSGLAAFRLRKFEEAAGHFENVALASRESDWYRAAGAFWAARAWLAAKKPEKVNVWLRRATEFGRTFYGALARRQLGMDHGYDFDVLPRAHQQDLDRIKRSRLGRRGFALLQLDEPQLAEWDLLRAFFNGGERQVEAYLTLGYLGKMPHLSYKVSLRLVKRTGQKFDASLYPLPDWKPSGGYRVDRALLYSMVRQESAFNAVAKSRAGARGLMQLMPATATFVGRDRSLRRRKRHRLFDPSFNLRLGQKYIRYLLKRPKINGNLFYALAAYNAGEGNLARWKYRDDPLMFIEAMHLRETRLYVEKVMYGLWVYRHRLGQGTPTLDALAAGKWPIYKALDDSSLDAPRYDER